MSENLEYLRTLDENNRKRICELLGADWDALNGEVYVEELIGYFDPARFMSELDILERKLNYADAKTTPEVAKHIKELFVSHLRYLVTNFEADKSAIS